MAHGYGSVHPRTAAVLRELGVEDGQITQGWGTAVVASAGYHNPEGRTAKVPGGQAFSSCVDLSYHLASRGFLDRLTAAGLAGFVRDAGSFSGNAHIHCIHVGLVDWRGRVTILTGPRTQIIDYTRGLSGLAGHLPITGRWRPTDQQRQQVQNLYEAWAPSVATRVYAPDGKWIPCYAFFELGTVRCEARPLLEWGGATVGWDGHSLTARIDVRPLDLGAARLRVAVEYVRGDVRALAAALGYSVKFAWTDGGQTAEVRLTA